MGGFSVPAIAVAVVQYLIAKRLLDAQTEARERLSAIALTSLEKAENLFAAFMELRQYDNIVYDWVKNLPGYEVCDNHIQRGRITGHLQSAELIRKGAFGHSRYNCGNREEAISLALSAGLISAGENMVNAHQFEELMQDGHEQLRWTSISTSASFDAFNPSGVFSSVARQLEKQDSTLLAAAGGSLFAFGNTARGLLRDVFSSNPSTTFNARSVGQSDFNAGIQTPSRTASNSPIETGGFSGIVPTTEI